MTSQTFLLAIIYVLLIIIINCSNGLKKVSNLQQFIATEKIEAEFYTSATYATIYDDCTQDVYLGDLSTATVLEYDQVDFGSGVQKVSLRVANVDSRGTVTIALHLSGTTGANILTIPINSTGSDQCAFVTLDVGLQLIPAGKQNLYITIPSGDGGKLFLDWFQFNRTSGGTKPATEIIQAEDFDEGDEMVVYANCSDVTVYANSLYSYAAYYQVDFGDGVQSVRVRGYTTTTGAESVVFRLGSSSGPIVATVALNYTGGKCNFSEWSTYVNLLPTGVQNLYLTFSNGYFYTYLDYFVFEREEGKWNATDKIEAEDYTSATNVSLYEDCSSDPNLRYVGQLQSNSVLKYDGVDFGVGVETVTLRISSAHTGAALNVTLHLGSFTSSPLANIPVGPTGTDNCDFYTVTNFLNTQPSGIQNLFFTFPAKDGGYLHLDWFQFNQTIN